VKSVDSPIEFSAFPADKISDCNSFSQSVNSCKPISPASHYLRETDEAATHGLAAVKDRFQAEETINELIYE
jgi:hypothetical protein